MEFSDLVLLLLIGTGIYFYLKRRRHKKEHENQVIEKQRRKSSTSNNGQFYDGQSRQRKDKPDYLKYTKAKKLVDDYTVLDFETTGFSPGEDKIIQFSAIKYRDHEKVDQISSLINPQQKLPTKITKITGLTDRDLKNAPKMDEKLPELIDFIDKETIVAHNAPFDMNFLLHNLHQNNIPHKNFRVIDTLSLARKHIHETENHKLATLKSYLNLDHFDSHESTQDCIVTAELYKYLYGKANKE